MVIPNFFDECSIRIPKGASSTRGTPPRKRSSSTPLRRFNLVWSRDEGPLLQRPQTQESWKLQDLHIDIDFGQVRSFVQTRPRTFLELFALRVLLTGNTDIEAYLDSVILRLPEEDRVLSTFKYGHPFVRSLTHSSFPRHLVGTLILDPHFFSELRDLLPHATLVIVSDDFPSPLIQDSPYATLCGWSQQDEGFQVSLPS